MVDAPPYPRPAGSRLLPELGVLACTLPEVASRMPTKKPRGQALPQEQTRANPALRHRRRRIEPVNRRVKRGRSVKARLRLWKAGVRDRVMALGGALHNCRGRLTPWQPMVESG